MEITIELQIQLSILAELDEMEYIGDLLIALIEFAEGLKPVPEDMPPVVAKMYRYWTSPGKFHSIFPDRVYPGKLL